MTIGLPLSVEANEVLRGLLFGSEAILAGSEPQQGSRRLDNVRDIYALFSARREDPPPTDILPDIEAMAADRVQRLTEAVGERITDIQNSGQPEPPSCSRPLCSGRACSALTEPEQGFPDQEETGAGWRCRAVVAGRWVAGVSDTFALGLLNEASGLQLAGRRRAVRESEPRPAPGIRPQCADARRMGA